MLCGARGDAWELVGKGLPAQAEGKPPEDLSLKNGFCWLPAFSCPKASWAKLVWGLHLLPWGVCGDLRGIPVKPLGLLL